MPNGFTALATLNGASTPPFQLPERRLYSRPPRQPLRVRASPTTALASQSASSGILRYPLDSATYYLALFIYSYGSKRTVVGDRYLATDDRAALTHEDDRCSVHRIKRQP